MEMFNKKQFDLLDVLTDAPDVPTPSELPAGCFLTVAMDVATIFQEAIHNCKTCIEAELSTANASGPKSDAELVSKARRDHCGVWNSNTLLVLEVEDLEII
ncbi:hypothetical protein EYZ11_008814 [Aspergillus tanneri]|uniref:Uncharacterized protein n=1 Tax=Aspergillus tanneri TaxID=1220188 RepID=A0A4S3JEZ8_9EURO|nr:hypothetical protein EYZ11_008814 [Aspergillus tanneri]